MDVSDVNLPPKEDHWLRMRVFLQHDPEERTASGEHQLVGTNYVTITHLQWTRHFYTLATDTGLDTAR